MPRTRRPPKQRRVALLIESTRSYARELLLGIACYNQERRRWLVEFTPHGLDETPPVWFRHWQGDGVLARVNDPSMAAAIRAKGVPAVDLRRAVQRRGMPSMGPNDAQVAQLVFDHFRDRGFRQYAFVGLLAWPHKARYARAEHFQRLVRAAGFEHFEFDVPIVEKGDLWDQQCRHLVRWLKELPRPAAIMTCNDDAGLLVLDACRRAEIPVPGEIAVAGVGNDECLCDLAVPPLTSVDLDPRRIGYEAAAWLDRMMDGQAGPQKEIQIAPRQIVARMSSDVMATDDDRVAKALRLIRERACEGLRVGEVLRHVCLSRTALEPRFKQVLGRTIHQEIQRVRLERVRELLAETDLPLKRIAQAAGYRYQEYLMRAFRRATGQTLDQYRKTARAAGRR